MTILSADTLLNVLDLIADGASVVETTAAIGGSPKSKIIFKWIKDSEAAADEFEGEAWLVTWREARDFFHNHYRNAVIDGKEIRAHRRTPLRAELEQRLAAKRAPAPAPSLTEIKPPVYDRVVQAPIDLDPPTKPARPAYAYRRPPRINVEDKPQGPPEEGRFSVSRHVVSRAEARAGTIELTDQGIRKW
jgi:hypothetical protein